MRVRAVVTPNEATYTLLLLRIGGPSSSCSPLRCKEDAVHHAGQDKSTHRDTQHYQDEEAKSTGPASSSAPCGWLFRSAAITSPAAVSTTHRRANIRASHLTASLLPPLGIPGVLPGPAACWNLTPPPLPVKGGMHRGLAAPSGSGQDSHVKSLLTVAPFSPEVSKSATAGHLVICPEI